MVNYEHLWINTLKLFGRVYMDFIRNEEFNPLSPQIEFYVDLLICATSWASNHKFMLLSKIFLETYIYTIKPLKFNLTFKGFHPCEL